VSDEEEDTCVPDEEESCRLFVFQRPKVRPREREREREREGGREGGREGERGLRGGRDSCFRSLREARAWDNWC